MKLKKSAALRAGENAFALVMGEKTRPVADGDVYIINALARRPSDKKLLELVMKTEELSEIMAGLRLAQLVFDYGDFLDSTERPVIET